MAVTNLRTSCAIIGGGYAGLATAIELRRLKKDIAITVFDVRDRHQKITQWHKLARGNSPDKYEIAFSTLAKRYNFTFVQKTIRLDPLLLNPREILGETFDAVVIAQGSASPPCPAGTVTLDTLRENAVVQEKIRKMQGQKIAVIGGGPTGVQFAFEFAARENNVSLYEARDRLLPTFDYSLGKTALAAAAAQDITVHLATEFLKFDGGRLRAQSENGLEEHAADFILFVPGVRAQPAYTCDVFGRIDGIVQKSSSCRFYAAGDNSYFSGRGLNTKSAQAAVRKGQHVARTIVADSEGRSPQVYDYAELGYFVSLGPKNAVGYMFSQKTAFSGWAALAMKEAIERQYNLYLAGLNVYF